jgi:hypothetical protein
MTKIGEDVSKGLDVIPAQWRILVTRRPKYVCRRCASRDSDVFRTICCGAPASSDQSCDQS